jgi:hypothetical protein
MTSKFSGLATLVMEMVRICAPLAAAGRPSERDGLHAQQIWRLQRYWADNSADDGRLSAADILRPGWTLPDLFEGNRLFALGRYQPNRG